MVETFANRIGGREIEPTELVDVRDPAEAASIVGRIAVSSPDDVAAATSAAAAAFREWSAVDPVDRATLLRAAAEALDAGSADRAILLARESGSLIGDARRGVDLMSRALRYYASAGETFPWDEELPSPNGRVVVTHQSMGVAAVIVPWNAPTTLGFLAIAPILMAGNTVVLKPPTDAPLALIDAVRTIEPLFPAGTLNVVTGPGPTVGMALVTDPRVRRVNFTGSTEAGKAVLAAAAPTVKRVSLELGGNDPAIVLEDADLDHAVPELVAGVFAHAGQICYDVKRIYVHQRRYADFVERFTAATDALVVGNGLDERATMGPVINESQQQRVRSLVEDARRDGATVRTVGQTLDPTTWERGHFLLPSVVTDVDGSFDLVACEQFGPAIPIMAFRDEDEAVALANDGPFGLSSSIWTPDEARAERLARRIEAGTTFINVHRRGASGVDMPFGGFKESGLGRSHGVIALEEQLEPHTISTRRPG